MFDVDLPQGFKGILLMLLFVFIVGSALVTTGLLPVLIALVIGAVVVYLVYVVLMRCHRLFMQGGLRSRGGGE